MIIKEMVVKKFRNMEDLNLSFGAKMTFIAGTNGTYKTSLLGLIGNSFTYRDKDSRKPIARTIMGDEFRVWLKDIHHFTSYDNVEEMEHTLYLTNKFQNKELLVRGYYRKSTGRQTDPKDFRFVVGKTRTKGEGHFILPVIYLGLKRLVPIGEHNSKNVVISNFEFSQEEKALYEKLYNNLHDRVLYRIGKNHNFSLEKIKTNNKEMIGGKNGTYDSRGLSAGQDNISQIATAIVSFAKLQREQGANYKGGILLIDEIESTLHPSALRRLLNVLYEVSSMYFLQIICTTHSLDTLKHGLESKYKNVSSVLYLTKNRGKFACLNNCSFKEIKEDMTARLEAKKGVQIPLYCEDPEAQCFLNNIIKPELKKRIEIIPFNKCYGFLENVATSIIAQKSNAIFTLDGEQPISKETKNVIVLPGDESPEAVIYHFLSQKDPNDAFFKRPNPHQEIYLGDFSVEPEDRNQRKAFFYNLKENLGPHAPRKIISAWKKENTEAVNSFNERLKEKIDALQEKLL